jgi:DNA processing protein
MTFRVRDMTRRISPGEAAYPGSLNDLGKPPPLWVIGSPELLLHPAIVAVVGTRRSTAYGERVTRELVRALARAGACIVSGMARGIDCVAHRTALDEGAPTIAVLGTGVDVPYPVGHRALHREIGAKGLLVSEAEPGSRAAPGCFPRRNRIIAALAQATLVVEAGFRSGALLTARNALDLGRPLAAVPGPIDVPQCAGSNELLRDGAVVIATPADMTALVGLTAPLRRPDASLSGPPAAVWKMLAEGPLDMDSLSARTGVPAAECMAAVSALEIDGHVECTLTGLVQRRGW